MRKRWFVGLVTILTGLAGLAAPLVLTSLGSGVSASLLVMAMLAFGLRGIAGTVGGVLVWRGRKLGYQLAVACWLYLVTAGLVASVQLFAGPPPSSPPLGPESRLFWRTLGTTLGKLLWGGPILYVLIRDLRHHGSRVRGGPA